MIEISHPHKGSFKVNNHRLKPYSLGDNPFSMEFHEQLLLCNPSRDYTEYAKLVMLNKLFLQGNPSVCLVILFFSLFASVRFCWFSFLGLVFCFCRSQETFLHFNCCWSCAKALSLSSMVVWEWFLCPASFLIFPGSVRPCLWPCTS